MTDPAIRTAGLRKSYRGSRRTATAGLDLQVPAGGGIHALLGPHGAQKTTVLRMLVGLARPSAGSAELFGTTVPRRYDRVAHRVGAVVEGCTLSPGLSGRKNLTLLAASSGVDRDRVGEVIEQVGVRRRDLRRTGRARIAAERRWELAAALLGSPDLLLLDEPTSGLDPDTARELRALIRALAEDGTTVLVTSHDLDEVRRWCDAVTVVEHGVALTSGPVAEVLGEHLDRTRVRVAEPDRAARLLTEAGLELTREGEDLVVGGHDSPDQITRILAEQGLYVRELSAVRPDLASFFWQLTGHHIATDEAGDEAHDDAGEADRTDNETGAEDRGAPPASDGAGGHPSERRGEDA